MLNKSIDKSWFQKWYPWLLTCLSGIALIASFWQAVERINMLKNPAMALGCNINPVVDCSGVLGNRLAALFGFPNAFIGIVMFSLLFMSGLALLVGVKPTKGFRNIVGILSKVAVLFSAWFFLVSLYTIGKVCIFCMFIWPASVALYWFGVQFWLEGQAKPWKWLERFANKFRIEPILTVYLLMVVLFLSRFRDFYFN